MGHALQELLKKYENVGLSHVKAAHQVWCFEWICSGLGQHQQACGVHAMPGTAAGSASCVLGLLLDGGVSDCTLLRVQTGKGTLPT